MPYIMEDGDISSDSFNNCLMIQRCISNMDTKNLLSDIEIDILVAVVEGYSYTEIANILLLDRQTISRIFKKLTDRIAYILGGSFTDAAFLDRVGSIGPIQEQDISALFKRGLLRNE